MTSDDAVLESLLQLAEDSFPSIFEPDDSLRDLHVFTGYPVRYVPTFGQIRSSRGRIEASVEALGRDEVLKPFAEAGDAGVFVTSNFRTGWRIQPEGLVRALVASASRQVIAKARSLQLSSLLEEVSVALDGFRRLVRGESIDTLVLTAFEDFPLAEETRLQTPWGEIRQAGTIERLMQPFEPRAPTAISVSTIPVRLQLGEPPDTPEPVDSADVEKLQSLAAGATLLSLTVALALRASRLIAPSYVWQTHVIPGQAGWSYVGRFSGRRIAWTNRSELDDTELSAISEWAQAVERAYDPSVQVAIRRTIAAIHEELDYEDSLIDAVVAWENLFGGTTEVGFRITTALTRLLEPDPGKRPALRKRLAKVYDLRSRLLHGDDPKPSDKLWDAREFAIRVSLDALAELVARPTLMADRDRATRVLLGDVPAPPDEAGGA